MKYLYERTDAVFPLSVHCLHFLEKKKENMKEISGDSSWMKLYWR
jgi:hypothetical protein